MPRCAAWRRPNATSWRRRSRSSSRRFASRCCPRMPWTTATWCWKFAPAPAATRPRCSPAIRITHIPTGIVVMMQDSRSQHKNRASAMNILRSRIYDAEQQRVDAARSAERKEKVGSGDRSERIRTYNFPQGRVTDHRINLTLYKLPQVIAGEAIGELIDALTTEHQAAQLAAQGAGA